VTALAALLLLVLLLSLSFSLFMGPTAIPIKEILRALTGGGDTTARTIVLEIRLPRLFMALLCGTALSTAGVIFQALLRNPLADPYLLGVSSGAALGAVSGMVLGLAALHQALIPLTAFAGGALAVAAVYTLARSDGGLPPHTLILAGVIISSLCSALVLFLNVMMEARQLQGALFWIMGSLAAPVAGYLGPVTLAVLAGTGLSLFGAMKMNLLTQGDEVAASLGLEVEREKKILFFAACLMTAAVVSMTGLIGFVGLVVPHAARMIFGSDHRLVLPAAAVLGSSLLLLSDLAARTLLAPAELPVGVVTALIGAPFFLYLLKTRKGYWSEG